MFLATSVMLVIFCSEPMTTSLDPSMTTLSVSSSAIFIFNFLMSSVILCLSALLILCARLSSMSVHFCSVVMILQVYPLSQLTGVVRSSASR